MAVSYSDKYILQTDVGFQNRVRASIVAAAINIASEGWAVAFHKNRADRAAAILLNPEQYKVFYAAAAATDANVIGDATQAGTVVLTAGNVAAQAALVTDAHLDAAISGQYNAFLNLP